MSLGLELSTIGLCCLRRLGLPVRGVLRHSGLCHLQGPWVYVDQLLAEAACTYCEWGAQKDFLP